MKQFIYLIHCIIFSLCSSTLLFAAENSEQNTTLRTLATPPVSTSVLLETLFGLFLVLSSIAFLAWLLRRTGGRFNATANGQMKIIAGLSLGPRERAVLLQVGEQQILVGVTAQHVQTLHVLETNLDVKNANSTSSGFAEKLQSIMKQRGQS